MEQIGKYRVVRLLGAGGMGRVYEAHDPLIDRRVAIKTLSLDILNDAEARSRFFREARAAGQLSHPHLITIFDTGESDGHPYLVMELLEGEDLSRVIVGRQLPLATKLQLMTQMCHGLAYAHDHGVVHRDIKPANVFLTPQGIKILDFGLARGAVSEVTQTGRVLGTPHYMAPEQIRGEGTDARVDIFSLGVVFYELLSGRKAFEGDSVAATIYKVLEFHPEPLHHVDSALPPGLSAIVARALAKDRTARYQRVDQMLGEIVRIQQQIEADAASRHATTVVTPVTPRAPARRSRAIAWTAAAVLLAAGAATATVFYRRNNAPPQAAEQTVRDVPPATAAAPPAAATTTTPAPAPPKATSEPPQSATPASRQAAVDAPSRRAATPAPQTLNAQPTAAPTTKVETPPQTTAPSAPRREPAAAERPATPPESRPSPPPPEPSSVAPPPAVTPPVVAPPSAPTVSAPAVPPPSAPAPTTAAPIENATAAVQETLGRYKAALEARNINALKQVWPGLSGRQEMATRSEFDNARSIAVALSNVSVQFGGAGTATVTCRRGYVVTTLDNHTLQSTTRMIVTMQRHNNSWVIDAIRHEADR